MHSSIHMLLWILHIMLTTLSMCFVWMLREPHAQLFPYTTTSSDITDRQTGRSYGTSFRCDDIQLCMCTVFYAVRIVCCLHMHVCDNGATAFILEGLKQCRHNLPSHSIRRAIIHAGMGSTNTDFWIKPFTAATRNAKTNIVNARHVRYKHTQRRMLRQRPLTGLPRQMNSDLAWDRQTSQCTRWQCPRPN